MARFDNPEDQKKYDEVLKKVYEYEKYKNPHLYAMLLFEEIEAFNKTNPDIMFVESPAYAAIEDHLGTLYPYGNEEELEFHRSLTSTVINTMSIYQLDYAKKIKDISEQIDSGEIEGMEFIALDPKDKLNAAKAITFYHTDIGKNYAICLDAINVVQRSYELNESREVIESVNEAIEETAIKANNDLHDKLKEYDPNFKKTIIPLLGIPDVQFAVKLTLPTGNTSNYVVNFRDRNGLFLGMPNNKKIISGKNDKELSELKNNLMKDYATVAVYEDATSEFARQAGQLAKEMENVSKEKKTEEGYKKLYAALQNTASLGKSTDWMKQGTPSTASGFDKEATDYVINELVNLAGKYSDPEFAKKVKDTAEAGKVKIDSAYNSGAGKIIEDYCNCNDGIILQSKFYAVDIKRIETEQEKRITKKYNDKNPLIDELSKKISSVNVDHDNITLFKQDIELLSDGLTKYKKRFAEDFEERKIEKKDEHKHKEYLRLCNGVKELSELKPGEKSPAEIIKLLTELKEAAENYSRTHDGLKNLGSGWSNKGRSRIGYANSIARTIKLRLENIKAQADSLREAVPENESLDNAYENMSWERKNYRNVISNHKKQIANSVNNDLFLIKSDEAISRLETASYRDQNELIRDAAYAYFGQSYRLIADMVPGTQKKYQETSLEEHMKKNINNPEFLKVLQAEDGSFKSPKQIAEEVKDQKRVKRLVDENMEKYKKQNLNKPVNNAAKKQENNAIKQENNVKANQSKPEDNKKAVNVLKH